MKMTIAQAFDMIERGETPEQYERRVNRLRRLYNERYELEDTIAVLDGDPDYKEKCDKKKSRLAKVVAMIEELK